MNFRIIKSRLKTAFLLLNYAVRNYSSRAGAPTGQTPAHAPHSMQVSASISNLPSPSEIALTGHSAAQAPQEMQSSEILYAIPRHLPSLLPKAISSTFTNTITHNFVFSRGKVG